MDGRFDINRPDTTLDQAQSIFQPGDFDMILGWIRCIWNWFGDDLEMIFELFWNDLGMILEWF